MSLKNDLRRLAKLTKSDGEQTLSSRSEELRSEGQRVADAAASAAAASAIATHEAAPDPHPQYLLAGEALTDPTTTEGDLIYRGAVALTRLGIGGAGTFLRSVGGVPAWVALTWAMIGSTPTTLAGYGITDAVNGATTRSANTVLAGPSSGAAAAPTFRALAAVDLPGNVAAFYTTAAGQNIANNTVTVIDYGTQVIDTAAAVTTGASWRFTAPIAGNYLVAAKVLYSGSTGWADTEFMLLSVYKNGSLYGHLSRSDNYSSASSVLLGINGVLIVNLAAGEYIDIRTQHTNGAALALLASAVHNHVSIVRV